MKSEIGECVYILYHKMWGKILIGNCLRSRIWWENRLKYLINSPII